MTNDEELGKNEEYSIELAGKILMYWMRRGYGNVKVWVERVHMQRRDAEGRVFYQIRSNLLNGMPRRDQ